MMSTKPREQPDGSPCISVHVPTFFGAHEEKLIATLAPRGLDVLGLLVVVGRPRHHPAQNTHLLRHLVRDLPLIWKVTGTLSYEQAAGINIIIRHLT